MPRIDRTMSLGVVVVEDNPGAGRYEIRVDGRLAGYAEYRGGGDARAITLTVIGGAFAKRGLATELIRGVLEDLRRRQIGVIPICSVVRAFLAKHPDYLDLVEPRLRASLNLG